MADLVLRDAALCELNELMGAMRPEELYGVEILAIVAILPARRNGSTRSSGHRPRYSNWSDRREATAPRRRRNHLGLAHVSLVVGPPRTLLGAVRTVFSGPIAWAAAN